MTNIKSTRKAAKSLSTQVKELFVERMSLPSFSEPFIGSNYLGSKLRVMVVCGYQFRVEKSDFIHVKDATYNKFFVKKNYLFKDSKRYRVSPYSVESCGFDLSGILENVDKKMSVKDVIIHRFVPYPHIHNLDSPIPDVFYKKAVEVFVGLIDICQPTHILIANGFTSYKMNENFKRFRGESLLDFFEGRYVRSIVCGEELEWNYYTDFYDDPIESVPSCAFDLLYDVDSAKIALNDPRLKPALYWDDDKIEYYGANEKEKEKLRQYKKKPDEVKKVLLYEGTEDFVRRALIRPFENSKYGKILYTKYDCLSQVYVNPNRNDWENACERIALHDENVKSYGELLKKKREARGEARIRMLSVYLKYAFINLSEKLRVKDKSKILVELDGLIDELYAETDKMYAVRKPIGLNPITERQKIARSINAFRTAKARLKKKTEMPTENEDDPPITYRPKKISQKQRDHLAKIRLLRWPNSKKSHKSV